MHSHNIEDIEELLKQDPEENRSQLEIEEIHNIATTLRTSVEIGSVQEQLLKQDPEENRNQEENEEIHKTALELRASTEDQSLRAFIEDQSLRASIEDQSLRASIENQSLSNQTFISNNDTNLSVANTNAYIDFTTLQYIVSMPSTGATLGTNPEWLIAQHAYKKLFTDYKFQQLPGNGNFYLINPEADNCDWPTRESADAVINKVNQLVNIFCGSFPFCRENNRIKILKKDYTDIVKLAEYFELSELHNKKKSSRKCNTQQTQAFLQKPAFFQSVQQLNYRIDHPYQKQSEIDYYQYCLNVFAKERFDITSFITKTPDGDLVIRPDYYHLWCVCHCEPAIKIYDPLDLLQLQRARAKTL